MVWLQNELVELCLLALGSGEKNISLLKMRGKTYKAMGSVSLESMILILSQDGLVVKAAFSAGATAYVKLREAPRFQREW